MKRHTVAIEILEISSTFTSMRFRSPPVGLVALAILMLEFFLSGRFRIISRHLGLDVTIRAHQLLAHFAAALLLLHPFVYTTPIMNYQLPDDLTGRFMIGLARECGSRRDRVASDGQPARQPVA